MRKLDKLWSFVKQDQTVFKIFVVISYFVIGLTLFVQMGYYRYACNGVSFYEINILLTAMALSFFGLIVATKRTVIGFWLVICICANGYTLSHKDALVEHYRLINQSQLQVNDRSQVANLKQCNKEGCLAILSDHTVERKMI